MKPNIQVANMGAVPTVRIAILSYNRKHYLRLMLKTIKTQSYANWTACVFDNGSTDTTADILTEPDFSSDSRFEMAHWSENKLARENFVRAIKWGEQANFFALLHDDDELEKDWLETSLNVLINNSQIGLVGSNTVFINNTEVIKSKTAYWRTHGTRLFSSHAAFLRWMFTNRTATLIFPSILYRSSVTKHVPFPAASAGRTIDIVWYCNLAKTSLVGIVYKPTFRYRLHPGQDSNGFTTADSQQLEDFFSEYLQNESIVVQYLSKSNMARCWFDKLKHQYLVASAKEKLKFIKDERAAGKLVLVSPIMWYYLAIIRFFVLNK